jgi:hypothetical protein
LPAKLFGKPTHHAIGRSVAEQQRWGRNKIGGLEVVAFFKRDGRKLVFNCRAMASLYTSTVMLMPGYKIVILFAMPSAYASKMAE